MVSRSSSLNTGLWADLVTLSPPIIHFVSKEVSTHIEFLDSMLRSELFLYTFLFIIFIMFHFRRYNATIDYRLYSDPSAFNLREASLKTELGDIITLSVILNQANSLGCKILSYLRIKLFIEIELPKGVKLNAERKYLEYKPEEQPQNRKLILIGDVTDQGRRNIELITMIEDNAAFVGEFPIQIKIYIGPDVKPLRWLSPVVIGQLGYSEINILPEK